MPKFENIVNEIAKHCPAFKLRRLSRTISQIYSNHLTKSGLNVSQLNLLVPIAKLKENATPKILCDILQMDKTTLSRAINILIKSNFIKQKNVKGSEKNVIYKLTKSGQKMIQEIYPKWLMARIEADDVLVEKGFKALIEI